MIRNIIFFVCSLFCFIGVKEAHGKKKSSVFDLSRSPILNADVDPIFIWWSYNEKDDWESLYPSCAGYSQSPIRLVRNDAVDNSFFKRLESRFYDTSSGSLILENTGNSIDASSTYLNANLPRIFGGPLVGEYYFDSIHWHWGDQRYSRGSEHTVDDNYFALELHLVHYSRMFGNIQHAISSGDPEALAVIGIKIIEDSQARTNLGLGLLIDSMVRAREVGKQPTSLPLAEFGLDFRDSYYTYQGSLTVPPCPQVVRWIFMDSDYYINPRDADVIRSVLVNGQPLVNTYRNEQPLNGRTVYYHRRRN